MKKRQWDGSNEALLLTTTAYGQETSLTLNSASGVDLIEIVLYLNWVLHKKNSIFAERGELCVLNIITLCEYVIDLSMPQTNL